MSEPNTIPPMTDRRGRVWDQPDRAEILLDDKHAVMSRRAFDQLHDYSFSMPTAIYAGKMWRMRRGIWLLVWLSDSDTPGVCNVHYRRILIVGVDPAA